jgi:hypothetical protein
MNPLPAPKVPGNTEFERFDYAVRKVFALSRENVAKIAMKPASKKPKKRSPNVTH